MKKNSARETPAILLAGGLGTRLRSVDPARPKPMVLVHEKPFLYWLIRRLAAVGYEKFILSTGYKAQAIADYPWNKDFPHLDFQFSSEESPLGTGGATKQVFERFQLNSAWVFNGDTLLENPIPFSNPSLMSGEDDVHYACLPREAIFDAEPNMLVRGTRVLKVGAIEESESRQSDVQCLFDAGQVFVTKKAVDSYSGRIPCSLHGLIESAIREGRAGFSVVSGPCFDIGTPERLERFIKSQIPSPAR